MKGKYLMNIENYKEVFSKDSIGRYDIAPIFWNHKLFNSLIIDLYEPFRNELIDKVVCIDAIGFIIGSALAFKNENGLVLVRKEGKIPLKKEQKIVRSFTDYTNKEKTLEMNKLSISKNDNVLIVDDWIETGSQVKAVISMLEELNARICGITCIGADMNDKTKNLFQDFNLHAIGVNA
jgi:adenine phosphoribosyltransferase